MALGPGDPGDGERHGALDHRLAVERASGEGLSSHQPALPLLRQVVRSADAGDAFAHPFEQDFSRILTYYRIRWAYEPTSFTLAWTPDGRPAEMFTPDFYLPDQRLYVELTTMRQRLVTRKHRKIRRLRELYPNIRIKLLYRRDYHRLSACYRPRHVRGPEEFVCRVGRVVHTEGEIRSRVSELAGRIAADLAAPPGTLRQTGGSAARTDPLVLLAVGRGSDTFARMLAEALRERGLTIVGDRVDLTRYRTAAGVCRVRVRRRPHFALADQRVLVVADVVSTGLSLRYLRAWLRRQRVAAVDVCALLDRRVARLVDVQVRYAAFEAPNELLIGCGLDLRRQFRDLPFIAALAPEQSVGD